MKLPALFPVHDKESHERGIALIEHLWNSEPGTPEFLILDAMATLVDAYETNISTLRTNPDSRGFIDPTPEKE